MNNRELGETFQREDMRELEKMRDMLRMRDLKEMRDKPSAERCEGGKGCGVREERKERKRIRMKKMKVRYY